MHRERFYTINRAQALARVHRTFTETAATEAELQMLARE